ncbi:uncharacterized protein [Leptinotarsa decemlineata]|uniref:uncharacterized protein n=1 Tax=Leptinotarsa decemlineata TaxID=7539 RepID=UPI000C2518ED|nr:uncharacterized protein LOC111514207 [Leptinotarsa decemlineata]
MFQRPVESTNLLLEDVACRPCRSKKSPSGDTMDYDTRLIEEVKNYPALYDNSHKDFKNKEVKQVIWCDITFRLRKQCDEKSVRTVRMRWKSLRDSYVKETKYKMAVSSGQNVKPRRNWRYSSAMQFLAPFLSLSFPVVATKEEVLEESEDMKADDQQQVSTYFLNVNPAPATNAAHFLGALLDYSRHHAMGDTVRPAENEIDSFFRGVADTVKKLSPVNQVRIQRDIVNMVLDVKLREVQGTLRD